MPDDLDYFVRETSRRLVRIERKIDILTEHRIQTMTQVKILSSLIAGFISLLGWILGKFL